MLAPRELVATGPSTPIAAAVSRVVVVLPLVPDTSAICRPEARWASRSGSMISPSRPPITEPSPRPVARDSAAAPRETVVASRARSGLRVVTRTRVAKGRETEYRWRPPGRPGRLAGVRDLLANRRLVIFWAGQAVSKVGDGMAPVAAAALALRYYG